MNYIYKNIYLFQSRVIINIDINCNLKTVMVIHLSLYSLNGTVLKKKVSN